MPTVGLVVEMLTQSEIDEVFHSNKRRADNYAEYENLMNGVDVGAGWAMPIASEAAKWNLSNEDYARLVRFNLNEAATHRTVAKDGSSERVKAPVRLNWKTEAHKGTEDVMQDGKKIGEKEVTIIDRLRVLVINSTVVTRNRAVRETVTVDNPPADAVAGAVTTLADGRVARL